MINHEVIVNLIGNTTTDAGLTIQTELDSSKYPTGIEISKKELQAVNLQQFSLWPKPTQFQLSGEQAIRLSGL